MTAADAMPDADAPFRASTRSGSMGRTKRTWKERRYIIL